MVTTELATMTPTSDLAGVPFTDVIIPSDTGEARRVQDEIDAGDVSETPLRALLSLLDDRELEEAAETWGVRVVPGLRGREDLTRQILQQVGDAHNVDRARSQLEQAGRGIDLLDAQGAGHQLGDAQGDQLRCERAPAGACSGELEHEPAPVRGLDERGEAAATR